MMKDSDTVKEFNIWNRVPAFYLVDQESIDARGEAVRGIYYFKLNNLAFNEPRTMPIM